MQRIDNARLEALQRALEALNGNLSTIQSYKPLKARHLKLKAKVESLETLRNSLSYGTSGTTAEKRQAFQSMRDQAVALSKIGWVWAKEQQDHELMQVLDLVASDFNEATALDALEFARNVEQALRSNLEALEDYEITAAEVNALKTAIDQSRDLMPRPRLSVSERKSLNESYRSELSEAMQLESDIENLLIGRFMVSHPDMVNQYLAASRIFDPHTRSTQVKIEVTNTQGEPMQEVLCDLLELTGEEQTTDAQGIAEITGIRSGTYTLEIKKEGYQPIKTTVQIKRGQKVQLKLQLVS